MAMRIGSKVHDGQVIVSCSDMLKSLYADLADVENPDLRKYIKGNIEIWEDYERSILIQAGQR